VWQWLNLARIRRRFFFVISNSFYLYFPRKSKTSKWTKSSSRRDFILQLSICYKVRRLCTISQSQVTRKKEREQTI
jgi:hypothetical protein